LIHEACVLFVGMLLFHCFIVLWLIHEACGLFVSMLLFHCFIVLQCS